MGARSRRKMFARSRQEKKKWRSGVCAVRLFSSVRSFGRRAEEGGSEQRHFPGNYFLRSPSYTEHRSVHGLALNST